MDNLIENENKNKIRTENDICYHMSVTSTYCAMYSFVDFESSLSLISMKKRIYTDKNP